MMNTIYSAADLFIFPTRADGLLLKMVQESMNPLTTPPYIY